MNIFPYWIRHADYIPGMYITCWLDLLRRGRGKFQLNLSVEYRLFELEWFQFLFLLPCAANNLPEHGQLLFQLGVLRFVLLHEFGNTILIIVINPLLIYPSFKIARLRRAIAPCKGKVRRVTRCLLSNSKDTLLSSRELKNPSLWRIEVSLDYLPILSYPKFYSFQVWQLGNLQTWKQASVGYPCA